MNYSKSRQEQGVLLYQTDDSTTRMEVRVAGETAWLNQSQMADLFQTTKQNVGQHIRNVFTEGELTAESVVKDYFTTAADGKQYRTKYYRSRLPAVPNVIRCFPASSGLQPGLVNLRSASWSTLAPGLVVIWCDAFYASSRQPGL